MSGAGQGKSTAELAFCRHCGKETLSATDVIHVGAASYEVVYCDECGIASSAFRLSREGAREGPADNLMLRRLRKPPRN